MSQRLPGTELRVPADRAAAVETFCTSGSSPTVHLVGPGRVGRAVLAMLDAGGHRVVGVTDSSATAHARAGLDAVAIAAWKAAGRRLCDWPAAEPLPAGLAVDLVAADVVVDTTSADGTDAAAVERCRRVLARGAGLVLASKDAVCRAPEWVDAHPGRIGFDAVLGGTGQSLAAELDELRRDWREVAIAGNASTAVILAAVERGATSASGIAAAGRLGLLEADPELDLSGRDAAKKLATVVGVLRGRPLDPAGVPVEHLRDVDPERVRAAARRGAIVRLVARAERDGAAAVRYEELPRWSPFAVPADRVAYGYHLGGGSWRVHTGAGLGPHRTARCVVDDVARVAGVVAGGAP